jgi:hypothetical protein
MEKFFWRVFGAFLALTNLVAVTILVVTKNGFFAALVIGLAVIDWIYKEKCPVWLEV